MIVNSQLVYLPATFRNQKKSFDLLYIKNF